ncbi:MAG: DUF1501 domain-containing protein, partial [Planctomycetota bacterium]|nr:DUF1501 domain-containing protein [Planctomycetota bacterium]
MNPLQLHSRRSFFDRIGDGLMGAGLLHLLGNEYVGGRATADDQHAGSRTYDLSPKETHFQPKAKRVIQLFMQGGPSQVDLFDPKPMLDKNHGKSIFKEIAKDLSSPKDAGGLMRSPFKFQQYGESGTQVSELLPGMTRHVDDIT